MNKLILIGNGFDLAWIAKNNWDFLKGLSI